MKLGRWDSGGEFVLDPGMNSASYITPNVEVLPEAWEVAFANFTMMKLKDRGLYIPRPGIYKGRPIFYGDLFPLKTPLFDPEEGVVIFSPSFGYKLVELDKVNPPSNHEYFKYFHPLYKAGMVVIYKESRFSHIVIGKTTYPTFNTKEN